MKLKNCISKNVALNGCVMLIIALAKAHYNQPQKKKLFEKKYFINVHCVNDIYLYYMHWRTYAVIRCHACKCAICAM